MQAMVKLWLERLRDSFLVIPGLMVAVAFVLGAAVPYLDSYYSDLVAKGETTFLLYDSGPDGARTVLGAVASSSVGIAATVFSITITTLVLASSQFGPRLLRTFTSDRGVQFALGTFLATFTYPLLVLRTVRTGTEGPDGVEAFVPALGVTLALALAVLAVAVLIYFINHVATMIRAPQVIAHVGEEMESAFDDQVPADGSRGDSDEAAPEVHDPELPTADDPPGARARKAGYITVVDHRNLVDHAERAGTAYRLDVATGDYVHPGRPLLRCHPDFVPDEEEQEKLADLFHVGARRTAAGDPQFGLNQLVEIAVRAMSPGVNDPFTAETCVQRAGAGLAVLVTRPFPDPRRRDEADFVRLLTRRPTFRDLVEQTFGPLRRYARSDAMLIEKCLESLLGVAERCPPERGGRLAVVREQADDLLAAAVCDGEQVNPRDRGRLEQVHGQVVAQCGSWGEPTAAAT